MANKLRRLAELRLKEDMLEWSGEADLLCEAADRIAELERQHAGLLAALRGIEIVEHGEGAAKEVWLLLRSDGNEIGAGSVRLDGAFAEAMSKYAEKRRAAMQAGKEP